MCIHCHVISDVEFRPSTHYSSRIANIKLTRVSLTFSAVFRLVVRHSASRILPNVPLPRIAMTSYRSETDSIFRALGHGHPPLGAVVSPTGATRRLPAPRSSSSDDGGLGSAWRSAHGSRASGGSGKNCRRHVKLVPFVVDRPPPPGVDDLSAFGRSPGLLVGECRGVWTAHSA